MQTENLLLLMFPLAFGCIPAILDSVNIRSRVPNLIVALAAATAVAVSAHYWVANPRKDSLVVAFMLLGVPGIRISYIIGRIIFWLT